MCVFGRVVTAEHEGVRLLPSLFHGTLAILKASGDGGRYFQFSDAAGFSYLY